MSLKIQPLDLANVNKYLKLIRKSWLVTYLNSDYGIDKLMIAEWLDRENPVEKADKLKHKINTGMLNDTFILLKSNELLGVIVFK